ncbi:MAG: hypothetical protein ACOCVF_02490 [bacterium]
MPQVLKIGSKNLNTENWKVFHPNGKHMFTCGEKKAYWYLERELAKNIGKKKIQLTFEPKGDGFESDEEFGLAGRIVQCVVSGEKEELQRHHIVPYCYRSWFPEEYKSKNHHDVVLVTYKIHEQYEMHASRFKDQLALEYGVPSLKECNLNYTKFLTDYANGRIKLLSRFHSIFRSSGNLPPEKIMEILRDVSMYTHIRLKLLLSFNYMQLYKLYRYLYSKHEKEFAYIKEENKKRFDHGMLLVSKLDTEEKLEEFIKRWRKHFIDTMNPPYMPIGWSIDFKVKVEL